MGSTWLSAIQVKGSKSFFGNRIQFICDHLDVVQWHYVPTAYNPADDSSRDLDVIKSSKFNNTETVQFP